MNFELDQDQQQLAESLRRWLAGNYDFEQRKAVIGSAQGTDPKAWGTFADMGLTALALSEDVDGFGQGATALYPVMEAFGEALVVEPFASTVVAARLVDRAGSVEQRRALLPGVAAGTTRLALAHQEGDAAHDAARVALAARRDGEGWVLDGDKRVALHAPAADRLVVSARVSGAAGDEAGLALFVIDAKAAGIAASTYRTFDNQIAADLRLAGVRVPADALLGEAGQAFAALDEALDFATALLCAEAVGAIKYANDATLEYIKTRKQFGVPIGSFQVLQHRMVDMVMEWEMARSMAMLAVTKVDGTAGGDAAAVAERRRAVSAAKIKISEVARKVAQDAVQMHGGMGLTEELKISHTFRRLTAISLAGGDVDRHLARFTGLQ